MTILIAVAIVFSRLAAQNDQAASPLTWCSEHSDDVHNYDCGKNEKTLDGFIAFRHLSASTISQQKGSDAK